MTQTKPTGQLWMWSLVSIIAVFILFFAGFAIWTYQKDVELVYDNYYDKDVVYEQQIRRIERTDALAVKPVITYRYEKNTVELLFPSQMGHINPAGEILLFRPADLHKDRLFPISLDGDTLQVIATPNLDKGLWRAKLAWKSGDLEYYLEKVFMVR